jgi:hypothetical protein
MTLDLFNYTSDKANEPVDIVLKNPVTNEDTDVVFQIVGLDSTAAQACMDRQQAKRFTEMSKDGEFAAPAFNAEENRQQLVELLATCTVGWKNLVWQGEELPYTPANALMVISKVPAIRELLNKSTGSRKLFFKG